MPNKDVILYLDGSAPPPVVVVTEADTAWTFRFTVMYNGAIYAPNVSNVILAGHKPDGNAFAFLGGKSGNVFQVGCNVQMTAVPGDVLAALHLLGGGNTAIPFILRVQPGGGGTAPVASASALTAYATILNRIGNFPPNLAQYVSDWLEENVLEGAVVDNTFTIEGAAAPAKLTGDRLIALENAKLVTDKTLTNEGDAADAAAVGAIFEEIGATHDTVIQFESGSYSETTPVDRSDRARTTDYVAVSAGDVLKQFAEGYEWWMFVFNEQKTLVSQSSAFASGDHTFDADGYFRLAVKRTDGGDITAAEIEALSAGGFMLPRRTAIPVVDNTLTKAGAAADAKEAGDRIKAIREEMQGLGVSDGVRYLLVEVLRNCLMSKDQSAMIDDLDSAMHGENGITKSGQTLSIRYLLNDTAAKSGSILMIR